MKKESGKFTSSFKAKVSLKAIKVDLNTQDLASKHQVRPSQIRTCKNEFLENIKLVFETKRTEIKDDSKGRLVYSKIGELQIEIDF